VRAITEAFGADNPVAENLRGVEDFLDSLLSAQSKADSEEIARLMKEAEDGGFAEQVGAALKGIAIAPIDFMANAVGTVIPAAAAALLAGPGLVGTAAAIGTGAVMGAGIGKGAIYDAVKDEMLKQGLTEEQAESAADEAQSYGGENLDQIALGTILGGWAAKSGLEPALARMLSTKAAEGVAKKGILKGAVSGAVTEAIPEAAQGGQEQLARNIALQREGVDVPTMRGVVGAGTLEGLAGGMAGAGVGAVEARTANTRRADQPRTRPEWTPVVSAYANMDMGKTEEEIYTRVGEVIADFGNEAATAYLSQVYGVEYTPTAEQEVEVLKGPGQIDSEPVELVSQVLDDVENSEWLADLDSEREATFQAAAELEEGTFDGSEVDGSTEGESAVSSFGDFSDEAEVAAIKGMNLTPQGEAAGVDPVLENDIDAGVGPTLGGGIEIDTGVGPALGEGIEAVPGNVDVISNLNDQGTLAGIDPAEPNKRGRPPGTGQQNDTAIDLRRDQAAARKRQSRVSDALLTTIETGQQKILDKRVARNKTIKFSDYFPTIEEFNQYTNNQRDAYDTEVKGLKLQYVTEGVAPEAAQTRAQVDANQKQIAANLLSDELQKLKAKRVKQLEKVIAIATDTKLEGKAAHTAALEVLNDPNIDPQERALAEDNVAATKAKQKPLGAIPAKTGPTPMFIGEKGVENLREQIEIYLLNPEGVVAPKIVPLDTALSLLGDFEDAAPNMGREALHRQTGWFEGIDNKWRIEISDEAGQFILPLDELVESPSFGTPTIYKLRDVYSHPLLYEIYPEAANIDFVYRPAFMDFFSATQGSYDGKNQIQVTPYAEDASSTLLHEIQHWVQQTEGFAEGGNERSAVNAIIDTFEADKVFNEVSKAIEAKLEKINAKQDAIYKVAASIPDVMARIEGIEEKKEALRETYGSPAWMETDEGGALQAEEKAIEQEIKNVLGLPESLFQPGIWESAEREVLSDLTSGDYKKRAERLVEEQNRALEQLKILDSNDKEALVDVIVESGQAYDLYRRLAGEVEARNIQTRRLMTVEERLANPPEETEDIDDDDQIIVIAGNTLYPPATVTELLNVPETEGLATQEPLFGAIEEVETAAEAADTIIIDPNRTPFERGLARVLKPVLQKLGTTFVIVKDPAQITNPNIVEIWATVDGKQISAGVFDPTNNVIYVDEVEGLQPRVVLHEMIHAATVYTLRRYFKNKELVSENARAAIDSMIVIMDSVGQYYQTLVESGHNTPELDKYYENTDGFNDLEEFVTYGLTGPALQTMLLNMAPVSKPQLGYIRTAFSNFAEAIGRLIGRPSKEYSAFEELIDLTGRVAAETMRNPTKNAGKVVQAKAKVKKQNAKQKAQATADTLRKFTNKSKGIVNATRNPEDGLAQFKAMFEAMGSKVKRASLAMLTGTMLTSLGDAYKMRVVRKVNNFIDRLKEFRNDKINKLLPNLDKWSVLTRDHKDTSETLEDVINLSTLFDVLIYDTDTKKLVSRAQSKLQDDGRDDVKTPEYPQGRPTGLKSIKFDLQQLSKNPNPDDFEQQEMDRLGKLLQDREEVIDEVFDLFDKMKALGGGSTAVELYSWALQEYRNDFEEQYALLLDNIRSDTTIEGTENDAASPKGKLMADIVASYQEARTRKVYAPLMRFGDWGVRVNPGSKDTAFYMFKNEAQQIQFMNFYQDQNPNDTVVAVSLNQEGRSFRDEMVADTERLRSMFNQIDALSQGNAEVAND
jgi:hypothetical protein